MCSVFFVNRSFYFLTVRNVQLTATVCGLDILFSLSVGEKYLTISTYRRLSSSIRFHVSVSVGTGLKRTHAWNFNVKTPILVKCSRQFELQ